MSKESQKFKVPDELANLYDFANTLDVRHFVHHGAVHAQGDELKGARELGAWMSRRGLSFTNAKISAAMLETALQLRAGLRDNHRHPAHAIKQHQLLPCPVLAETVTVITYQHDDGAIEPWTHLHHDCGSRAVGGGRHPAGVPTA